MSGKQKELGDGLVLRCLCKSDIKSLKEHVKLVHGEEVVGIIQRMLDHYPHFSLDDNFVVVDTKDERVVAYLCLMQRTFVLEGVKIPVGQPDIVGTHPDYRNKGLVRHLNAALEERAAEYHLQLLSIAGIPYYYRQFGYEYAAPMTMGLPITTEAIPQLKEEEEEPVSIELVTKRTFPDYLACREKVNSFLDLYYDLGPEHFLFYSTGELSEPESIRFFLVKEKDKVVGAFYLGKSFGSLVVRELWLQHVELVPPVLRFLKTHVQEHQCPLKICPPSKPSLMPRLERIADAKMSDSYAWYIRIPSIKQFLETISPILEKRLARSEFKGLTDTLKLSCYREGFELVFRNGELTDVNTLAIHELQQMEVSLPPLVINQLLLGYRTIIELQEIYPDVLCYSTKQGLVEVLFPKIRASITPSF
jgi:predicted N-acetyltransferase YhbS